MSASSRPSFDPEQEADHVVEVARHWRDDGADAGEVVDAAVAAGWPRVVAEHAVDEAWASVV